MIVIFFYLNVLLFKIKIKLITVCIFSSLSINGNFAYNILYHIHMSNATQVYLLFFHLSSVSNILTKLTLFAMKGRFPHFYYDILLKYLTINIVRFWELTRVIKLNFLRYICFSMVKRNLVNLWEKGQPCKHTFRVFINKEFL